MNWTEPISLGFVPLQAAAEPSPFSMLVPMGMIFLIFYFLLIRPQQKRQKEQDEMLKAIEKGDSVVTLGGLHGKVVGVTDDVLTLEIATLKGGERIRVKAARMKVDTVQKAKKGEDS
ncbi:MAG: preprotein translocase subunit YajC [Myxococcota bacterium]